MFMENNILKTKDIRVNNGDSTSTIICLSIDQDNNSLLVTVTNSSHEDILFYWIIDMEEYSAIYFDVRDLIYCAIEDSKNLNDFIETFNEFLNDEFCSRLIGSSYMDEVE